MNKPSLLFKRSVDLSNYNAIARAVTGVRGGWYLLQKVPESANLFRVVVDFNFTARNPIQPEPSVCAQYLPDSKGMIVRQKVTDVNRTFRPSVDAGITWNLTKYAGLAVRYKYGSLPPLFEFVDHQVTVGFTIKAKQK